MSKSHDHEQLIEQFYAAFKAGDAITMTNCYAPDATFEDPVFGRLEGAQVGAMWQMLVERSKGALDLSYGSVRGTEEGGSAAWEAKYTFSQTGRKVHNKIQSTFVIREGKIIEQVDRFDFWKWSSMALGWPGRLLGFTPFLRKKVSTTALQSLSRFQSRSQNNG